jgi:hypothetical protein
MARAYAGVLGFLGFAVTVARGMIDGQQATAIIAHACLAMIAFAIIGGVVGVIGEAAVWQSVEQNLQSEIDKQRAQAANEHGSRRIE